MKRLIYIILAMVFLVGLGSGWAFSQQEAEQEVDVYYTYGTVVNVSPESIEIVEYDDETYEEVQSAYQLNAQTQWVDGISYADIQIEDEVDIEYQMVEGARIAVSVEKYNQLEEEQPALLE